MPVHPTKAMVLAAGLGVRMRPLTDKMPKPLVRVAGQPLLDYVLDKLAVAGVSEAVVNVHYLPDQIIEHTKGRSRPKVTISDERDQVLGTGGGGSPYQGESRPLCDQKLISVVDATQQVTNFELFTDVPLASHFWGLILNDLGVSSDPTKIQYGEVEGLQNAPTGIYDWAGNLIDTAISDRNGFYEAVEPSTQRINNPSPTGVSPGMYRFVGNDPGQPGHYNPDYDPRFRTIATNFQAWPGEWTVTAARADRKRVPVPDRSPETDVSASRVALIAS